jgi:hypothetical protein
MSPCFSLSDGPWVCLSLVDLAPWFFIFFAVASPFDRPCAIGSKKGYFYYLAPPRPASWRRCLWCKLVLCNIVATAEPEPALDSRPETRPEKNTTHNNNKEKKRRKSMADIDIVDAMAVEPIAPTLADLPSEIRDGILRLLTKPRDLAAARCASRLFDGGDMKALTVRWAARYMFDLVGSRAPLHLIAAALYANVHIVGFNMLDSVAMSGRMDVARLVHAVLEVRDDDAFPREYTHSRLNRFLLTLSSFFCFCCRVRAYLEASARTLCAL